MKKLKFIVLASIAFVSLTLFGIDYSFGSDVSILNLKGEWKVFTEVENFGNKFKIEQDNNKISIKRGIRSFATGEIKENKFEFTCSIDDKAYTFNGYASHDKILGTIRTDNNIEIPFEAEKMSLMFKCGNHVPSHIAEGKAQMQSLVHEYNCKLWKVQ
jgi:hypothetical protein